MLPTIDIGLETIVHRNFHFIMRDVPMIEKWLHSDDFGVDDIFPDVDGLVFFIDITQMRRDLVPILKQFKDVLSQEHFQ